MNVAIIDLGTNTFNLLIAKLEEGSYKPIFATKEFVQLGKGGINDRIIQSDAFLRGIKSLETFQILAKQYKCEKISCIATSAIRNARNGGDFANEVKQQLGLDIQIIDGSQEAELIYLGAKQAVDMSQGTSLIMDVGGGSTEFIICSGKEILWKQSFEVGVARLFEKFHHTDPISKEEVKEILVYLNEILSPLLSYSKGISFEKLIGCSGAFSSFASIILHQQDNEDEIGAPNNYRFNFQEFKNTHDLLLSTSIEDRLKIEGLVPQRAPMIVVGAILVNFILDSVQIKHFEMSKYALKEGAVFNLLKK